MPQVATNQTAKGESRHGTNAIHAALRQAMQKIHPRYDVRLTLKSVKL